MDIYQFGVYTGVGAKCICDKVRVRLRLRVRVRLRLRLRLRGLIGRNVSASK